MNKPDKPPKKDKPVKPPPSGAGAIVVTGRSQPITIRNRKDLVIIRFAAGASIVGTGQDGILLVNCPHVRIEGNGGKITGFQNGIRIADTGRQTWDQIVVMNLDLSGNRIQGVLTVNAFGVTVQDCKADGIQGSDKAHFVYNSAYNGPTGNCRVVRCHSRNVKGSDYQGNAETWGQPAGPFELIDCDMGNDAADFALSALSSNIVVQGGRLHGRVNADDAGGGPSRVLFRNVQREGRNFAMGGSEIKTA